MSFLYELKRRHVIRVALAYLAGAWLLIQVLETLFPIFGLPEQSIRVVVISLAIGFAPALVLSWVFEWTPGGLRPDAAVADDTGQRQRNTRTLDRIIIVTLTIALVLFAVDEFLFDARQAADREASLASARAFSESVRPEDISVAVLPFSSLATSPEHEHFAHGITEELIVSLASVPGLRVSSKTSVFALDDRSLPVGEVAAVLGVGHVLEGSVRRSGERVRVTTSLVDAGSDRSLWTRTFDRELSIEDVLDIQAEIAASVSDALRLALLDGATKPSGPVNLEALDRYHDGLYYLRNVDPLEDEREQNFERARQAFEESIEIDPKWAPPRAMLGMLYHKTRDLGDPVENLRIAEEHVAAALQLDPGFGPAHVSMAYLKTIAGNYAAALDQYDLAIRLGADQALWGKAILLRVLGRHDAAIDAFVAAALADPLSEVARFQLFETYYCAGRYAESIDGLTRFVDIDAGAIYARILLATAYAHTGETETALRLAGETAARIGREGPLATVYALSGDHERARAALDEVDREASFIAVDVAPAAVLIGEPDRALDILEDAAAAVQADFTRPDVYSWLWRFQCSPVLRQLEDEPRYLRLLEQLGLPLPDSAGSQASILPG